MSLADLNALESLLLKCDVSIDLLSVFGLTLSEDWPESCFIIEEADSISLNDVSILQGNLTISTTDENADMTIGKVEAGGDIQITADRIELTNGGQLLASSSAAGEAGSIDIVASETIVISDVDENYALQVQDATERFGLGFIGDLRRILNRQGENGVAASAARQRVAAGITGLDGMHRATQIDLFNARQRVGALTRCGGVDRDLCTCSVHAERRLRAIRCVDGPVARTCPAVDGIVASATCDDVVARITIQRILPTATVQGVGQVTAVERIVTTFAV